jgi:serine-protein kinase ATM
MIFLMNVNTGTEGTFSRAAEETARVLRDNANALLTILSAVVSDPLYRWSVSPVQARRRQTEESDEEAEGNYGLLGGNTPESKASGQESDEDHNKAAAETLVKIQEKLQGYEDGTSGEQQSVEGQVQLLVNQARDPGNLCQVFVGWSPWV